AFGRSARKERRSVTDAAMRQKSAGMLGTARQQGGRCVDIEKPGVSTLPPGLCLKRLIMVRATSQAQAHLKSLYEAWLYDFSQKN
ncbi:MAG TPA: hypothetical protein VGE97_03850, partial [Nitrososphaera sp.]